MPKDRSFRLYNTSTREVEPLELQEDGHLRFYGCGPTVYAYAHIGNFRSFLTADLILRTAQAIGWETTYVSNVTDVGHLSEDDVADAGGEDKMARALEREGQRFRNVWDLARYYTEALLGDWQSLKLREPDVRPRATDHMRQQIQAVERLMDNGHAYETEQGVYFSVDSFPDYGMLSGNDAAEQLQATERQTVSDPQKKDPRDFALWKKDPNHLMQWHSPWGWGFPGWHIECSVMAMEYIGETLDLHTGGEDLIFPHHDCEIAQSESITGERFANHWIHTRFLQVEGEKMSKSAGNFYTVRDLIASEDDGGRGIDPVALRLALISGQYRKPYNFTMDTLQASARHIRRFRKAHELISQFLEDDGEKQAAETDGHPPGIADETDDPFAHELSANYDEVLSAMLDDLNTPAAIASALDGVKLILNKEGGFSPEAAKGARRWLARVDDLLGIAGPKPQPAASGEAPESEIKQKVESLLAQRRRAREKNDYERADAIRDELEEMGVEVMDSAGGTTWRKKISI